MTTLYDIGEAMRDLLVRLDEAETPEDVDEICAELDFAGEQEKDKVGRYCGLIAELERRAEARRSEAQRLTDLERWDRHTVGRLKATLLRHMEEQGRDRIDTDLWRVTRARNGGAQPFRLLVNESDLPVRYRIVSYQADRRAILENLEVLEEKGIVKRLPRGHHLRIR